MKLGKNRKESSPNTLGVIGERSQLTQDHMLKNNVHNLKNLGSMKVNQRVIAQ